MKKIDKNELKLKMDMLYEFKNIRYFLDNDYDCYTIKIKRERFNGNFDIDVFIKKITIDVETLKELIDLAINNYEKDIDKYLRGE